jgi:hypothetical protein
MPRVAKKDTPAKKEDSEPEEIQTVTQSRSRRTPKPNPKYGNDSFVFTPKAMREDPIEERKTPSAVAVVKKPIVVLSKTTTVKKIIPKKEASVEKETPSPSESRSLRNRATAQSEPAPATKTKASGPTAKKQKLEFDEDDSDGDKKSASTAKSDETKVKSKPAETQLRVTRSRPGDEPAAVEKPIEKSGIFKKVPAKAAAAKTESPGTSKKEADKKDDKKTIKADDGFVTIVNITDIIQKKSEKDEPGEKAEKLKAVPVVTRASQSAGNKTPSVIAKGKDSPASQKASPASQKASPAAQKAGAVAKASPSPKPGLAGVLRARTMASNKKSPSPAAEKRKSEVVEKDDDDDEDEAEEVPSPKRLRSSATDDQDEDEQEEKKKPPKTYSNVQKLMKNNPGLMKNPVVVLKKTSTAQVMKAINNGAGSQPAKPRILNSSVMAATRQSSNVKLLNSTKSDKLFSIDLTEEPVENKTKDRKATIVTITNKGLQNSSNLVNKTQSHNNLNKSLNNSLKLFKSSQSQTPEMSQKSTVQKAGTPATGARKQLTPTSGGQKKQETVTTIGNTKRITRFESWFIIDCPKQEVVPQKHNHSYKLVSLGNALDNIKLPSRWDYRVNLKRRHDGKKENNNNLDDKETEEIYIGEIFDKTIKEQDRRLYEVSNIMFKRTSKASNRAVVDRSVFFRENTYTVTIDGKNCKLIGAPDEVVSFEDIEILLDIVDSVGIGNVCVEQVTNEHLIL